MGQRLRQGGQRGNKKGALGREGENRERGSDDNGAVEDGETEHLAADVDEAGQGILGGRGRGGGKRRVFFHVTPINPNCLFFFYKHKFGILIISV